MSYDEHPPHDVPLLFLTPTEPRCATVCEPHRSFGVEGERVYITEPIRSDPLLEAKLIVASAIAEEETPFSESAYVERILASPDPALARPWWEEYVRGELAVRTLRSLAEASTNVHFEVLINGDCLSYTAQALLAQRFSPDDERVRYLETRSILITTSDIEDVHPLLGWRATLLLCWSLKVVMRSSERTAVVMYNIESERIYFIASDDVFERELLAHAGALDLLVAEDLPVKNQHHPSGTIRECAALREWIDRGAPGTFPNT